MKTNRKWLVMITFVGIITILTGCTSFDSTDAFPKVQSTFISPYNPMPYRQAIITPNGKYLTMSDLTQVELSSGKSIRPFDAYLKEWQSDYFIDNMIWSPDGRYLTVGTHLGGPALPPVTNLIFIIDTQTHSISEPLEIGPILYGSPFGKRILATPFKGAPGFWHVYDENTKSSVPMPEKTMEINMEQTAGAVNFLWSQTTNMPVAAIDWRDPINAGGIKAGQELGVTLSRGGENGQLDYDFSSYSRKFESIPPDNIINAIFDPQGKYILIIQWKCSEGDPNQCSLYPGKEYFKNITDTALILVNWRTGEQQELIRLSEVDPLHVVARYATWSADGSTILVWRKDASPIVLKIKYP